MRRAAPFIIIALSLLLSLLAWAHLPEVMAIHWGVHRRPDGWAPRIVGALVIPVVQLLLLLILRAVTPMQSKSPGGAAAVPAVELTIAFIIGFMGLVHATMLAAALGWRVDVVQIVVVGLSALFVGIGTQLSSIPRNPWYGYRTRRTMRSDRAWARTHRVAGPVMVVGGAAMAITTLLRPDLAVWTILGGVLVITLAPLIYVYAVDDDADPGDS